MLYITLSPEGNYYTSRAVCLRMKMRRKLIIFASVLTWNYANHRCLNYHNRRVGMDIL